MGKKQQQAVKFDAPPPLTNRDHLERAHFAIQAAVFLQGLAPFGVPATAVATDDARAASAAASSAAASARAAANGSRERAAKGTRAVDEDLHLRLARSHMTALGEWTKGCQVKTDPSFKRAICRACSTVLVPGLTSRVRVKPSKSHGNTITTTCLTCAAVCVLPAAPYAAPEAGVDGPVRARRRARKMRPAPFHIREAAVAVDAGSGAGGTGTAESTPGTEPPAPRRPSVKAEAKAARASCTAGHQLWAGNERVHGWGEATPTPGP